MKLTVITHVWNEAFLFPYWLRHHYPMFDHGVVIDYRSTDGTPDLVRQWAPGWEVRQSRNALFGARQADLEVMDVEREFDGWKIVLNATEFLYHRDLRGLLRWMSRYRPDVRGLWAKDVVMVDHPQSADDSLTDEPLFVQKRFGYPGNGARSRLLHRCADGRYVVGRHFSQLVEKVLDDEILLAWFGWCPIKPVWQRKLAIQRMIPDSDKRFGLGRQHLVTEESLRRMYDDETSRSVDLIEACPRYAQVMAELTNQCGSISCQSGAHGIQGGSPVPDSSVATAARELRSEASRLDVSVVIPACNSAPFIARALRSVFSQSRLPREVIVVDDASTDDTPHIVHWLAEKSNVPIRLLRLAKRSGGPARPLNVGIHAAVAPLIATLDHDDAMLANKLEQQVACLDACPGAGAALTRVHMTGYELGGERNVTAGRALDMAPRQALGGTYYRIAAKDAYEALLTHGYFWNSCSNFVFPKVVFERCGPFIERLRLNADYGFLQSVAKSYDLALVDDVLLECHLEPEGLFRTSRDILKSTETLFVLRRFDRRRLSAKGRRIARRRLLRELWHYINCDRPAPLCRAKC